MSPSSADTGPGPETKPSATVSRISATLRRAARGSIDFSYACASHDLTAAHAVCQQQAATRRTSSSSEDHDPHPDPGTPDRDC